MYSIQHAAELSDFKVHRLFNKIVGSKNGWTIDFLESKRKNLEFLKSSYDSEKFFTKNSYTESSTSVRCYTDKLYINQNKLLCASKLRLFIRHQWDDDYTSIMRTSCSSEIIKHEVCFLSR